MTPYTVPALIAAATIALTWFFCLRPMHRGICAMPSRCATPQADADARAEIQTLTRELAEHRAKLGLPPSD